MTACKICGNEDFEKHDGYLYCTECQTQSQDYQEQAVDIGENEQGSVLLKKKKSPKPPSVKESVYEGSWITWEIFNYILHGMTQELKKIGVPDEFETTVLQIWSCFLWKSNVAFLDRFKANVPRLSFHFRKRDAVILHNLETNLNKKRKRRKSGTKSSASVTSVESKRTISRKKVKMIEEDYSVLSMSLKSDGSSNLGNETLESLGRSYDSDMSLQPSEIKVNVKKVFTKKTVETKSKAILKKKCNNNYFECKFPETEFLFKSKLLGMIYLALLITKSKIQLSDLLRFIREGHLSYAKVTHFLPKDVKLVRKDVHYIESVSDLNMPTHLKQRLIAKDLCNFLKIEKIPFPKMDSLIKRYCRDLQLPDEICHYSKKILGTCFNNNPDFIQSRLMRDKHLPNFEGISMAVVLLVMKLFFGLDGKTEIILSAFSKIVNRLSVGKESANLFVFQDWQKYIECRKTILIKYHYPTQEQLEYDECSNSHKFIDMLVKDSKDEHRNERFTPYRDYFMDKGLVHGIKNLLSSISRSESTEKFNFKCSLKPQSSHLKTIKNVLESNRNDEENLIGKRFPWKVLNQNFKKNDVKFVFNRERYFQRLEDAGYEIMKIKPKDLHSLHYSHHEYKGGSSGTRFTLKDVLINYVQMELNDEDVRKSKNLENHRKILILDDEDDSNYWIRNYSGNRVEDRYLENFKSRVLNEMPKSFQWLITEAARMLEMNVRDLFDELLLVEEAKKNN